jgi:membrane associated rhomboid family serine protease
MPAATGILLIANVLGYLLQMAFDPTLTEAFGLWIDPDAPLDQLLSAPWQLVTYSFLHGSGLHLGLNLFALWMFGADSN